MSSKNSPLNLDEALSSIQRLEPRTDSLNSEECLYLVHCYLVVTQNHIQQQQHPLVHGADDWSEETDKELAERQRFEEYLERSIKLLNDRELPEDDMLKADWFFLKTSLYLLQGDPLLAMESCKQCEEAVNNVSNLVFRSLLQEQLQQAKAQCERSLKELNEPTFKDPKGFTKHSFMMGVLRKDQEYWLNTPNLFYERLAYAKDFTVIEYAQYNVDPKTHPDYFSILVRAQYLAESAEAEQKRAEATMAERREFIRRRNERLEKEKQQRPSYQDVDISNLNSEELTEQLKQLNERNKQLSDVPANRGDSGSGSSGGTSNTTSYGGFGGDAGMAASLYALESLNAESTANRHGAAAANQGDGAASDSGDYTFNISRDSFAANEDYEPEEKSYSSVDFAKSRAISVKEAAKLEKLQKQDHFQNAPLFHVFYKEQIFNVRIFATEPEQLFYNWRARYRLDSKEEAELAHLKKGIAVIVEGGNNPYDTFKLQLLMLCTLVPNLALMVDESSEQIFPGDWVRFNAQLQSDISSTNLYSIQAVSDGNRIWLHTHGLSRFKLGELEILNCPANQFQYYGDVINTLAAIYLRHPKEMQDNNVQLLAHLPNDTPLLTTLIPWPEAVQYYNKQGSDNYAGSARERTVDHNSLGYVIFSYDSLDCYKRRDYKPLYNLTTPIDSEAILMLPREETFQRMKTALETFPCVYRYANSHQDIVISIKAPLQISKSGTFKAVGDAANIKDPVAEQASPSLELCWFTIVEIYDDGYMKGRLENDPFYIKDLNKGDYMDVPINLLTDWRLYDCKTSATYSPSSAFMIG